jgi:uncharacterized LabA/DUF88 family protein
MSSTLRTTLYVDGFNLYYGAAKNTRLKWVNVIALAECVLPGVHITKTRYFTAMVKSDATDLQRAQRQQTYLRALETLPNLTVHKGWYQHREVAAKRCTPPHDIVTVYRSEEKGTDVNLATYMLADAFRDDCDQLVLITNDADLTEPVRIINSELNKKVLVLNPQSSDTAARKNARTGGNHKSRQSYHLKGVAFSVTDICSDGNNCHMTRAQFPHTLQDAVGTITIPAAWT